jgi:hypothetical protein
VSWRNRSQSFISLVPELSDELGQDGFLFHEGKLLADAVTGSGGERDVGVWMAGSRLDRKNKDELR